MISAVLIVKIQRYVFARVVNLLWISGSSWQYFFLSWWYQKEVFSAIYTRVFIHDKSLSGLCSQPRHKAKSRETARGEASSTTTLPRTSLVDLVVPQIDTKLPRWTIRQASQRRTAAFPLSMPMATLCWNWNQTFYAGQQCEKFNGVLGIHFVIQLTSKVIGEWVSVPVLNIWKGSLQQRTESVTQDLLVDKTVNVFETATVHSWPFSDSHKGSKLPA